MEGESLYPVNNENDPLMCLGAYDEYNHHNPVLSRRLTTGSVSEYIQMGDTHLRENQLTMKS